MVITTTKGWYSSGIFGFKRQWEWNQLHGYSLFCFTLVLSFVFFFLNSSISIKYKSLDSLTYGLLMGKTKRQNNNTTQFHSLASNPGLATKPQHSKVSNQVSVVYTEMYTAVYQWTKKEKKRKPPRCLKIGNDLAKIWYRYWMEYKVIIIKNNHDNQEWGQMLSI